MKISQEINKVLYYPLTDDTMMSKWDLIFGGHRLIPIQARMVL